MSDPTTYAVVQLGQQLDEQMDLIRREAERLTATQLRAADRIVASEDRVLEGVRGLEYGLDDVANGLEGLRAAFEWGISEVIWQLERNREELRNIVEVLSAPLDTQARELRKRAEEAYGYGWLDEALADFLLAETKNPYDFAVQISIGTIYLFHLTAPAKADPYFDKAVKFARPKSPYHASYALLHRAHIASKAGDLRGAAELAHEAASMSPGFAEAWYQHAHYCARRAVEETMADSLANAIRLDRRYALKVGSDSAFDAVREKVQDLFRELRDELLRRNGRDLDAVASTWTKLNELLRRVTKMTGHSSGSKVPQLSTRARELRGRMSYLDALEASETVREAMTELASLIRTTIDRLEKRRVSLKEAIRRRSSDRRYRLKGWQEGSIPILILGPAVSFVIGFVSCFLTEPVPEGFEARLSQAVSSWWKVLVTGSLLSWAGVGMLNVWCEVAKRLPVAGLNESETQIHELDQLLEALRKLRTSC